MLKNYVKLIVAILFVSNVMAQNIPSYVPTNGLVGWWPFNGNANDESGNGNHGTVNGATLTADRNGIANCAYNFDGFTNYISGLFKKLPTGDTSCSISIWFNTNNKPNNGFSGVLFMYGVASSYNGRGAMIGDGSGNCQLGFSTVNSYKTDYRISSNYNLNEWYHLTITYNSPNVKIYLNGVLIGSGSVNKLNTLKGSFYIGRAINSDSYFSGKIDDIAIFNRALSEQEIKQLYEGCSKETATSSSFNSVVYTTNTPINLSANPTGGIFNGEAVANNTFNPSKAKLGKNQVKYTFKNSTGCTDSTNFTMILVDTLGNKCSTYDTLKIKVQLTTGIKAGQQTSMNVYPNPTSDILIIEANDIQALSGYRYKIIDLQGKEVYNALATSTKTEISIKSIGTKGMYILHILDEKGISIENKKIVLE